MGIPWPEELPCEFCFCDWSLSAAHHFAIERKRIIFTVSAPSCVLTKIYVQGTENPCYHYIRGCGSRQFFGRVGARGSSNLGHAIPSFYPPPYQPAFPSSLACSPCIDTRINEQPRTHHPLSCCFLHVSRFGPSAGFLPKTFSATLADCTTTAEYEHGT